VTLNQTKLALEAKEGGRPYFVMDLLPHSGLDLEHMESAVRLEVNGVECGFQRELKENDCVTIRCV
jgi:hypothetical protein